MSRFDLMVMKDQLEWKWSFNSQLGKATSHEILKHHGVAKGIVSVGRVLG
jgi:hypothetical protein